MVASVRKPGLAGFLAVKGTTPAVGQEEIARRPMDYVNYLRGIVGQNGSLTESHRSWFTFTVGLESEDYQLAEVNDDFVIVQCNELPTMIDAIPIGLFQIRIYQKQ